MVVSIVALELSSALPSCLSALPISSYSCCSSSALFSGAKLCSSLPNSVSILASLSCNAFLRFSVSFCSLACRYPLMAPPIPAIAPVVRVPVVPKPACFAALIPANVLAPAC